jgi:voltage-gated potassium channel
MPRYIRRTARLRRRLYEILEHGTIADRTGLMVGRLIVALIVVNLVSMTLDSVPALQTQYGPLFTAIELISLVVFTIEYALRVWVAAEHAPQRHATERKARWKFVSSPLGVIDLRGSAFLARISIAARSSRAAGVSDGPLSQVGALLARNALAAGCSL